MPNYHERPLNPFKRGIMMCIAVLGGATGIPGCGSQTVDTAANGSMPQAAYDFTDARIVGESPASQASQDSPKSQESQESQVSQRSQALQASQSVQKSQKAPAPQESQLSEASQGLHVPELTQPARAYSDLLWTKDDYRAWSRGTDYQSMLQNDPSAGVFPLSFVGEPVASPPGAMSQWRLGERNWQYAADNGLAVRLGSSDVGSSVLAGTATLGGLHIRQSTLGRDDDDEAWSMSFALGALDYSGDDKDDLVYGPAAANTVINYGLNEHLALESAVQVAPDLVTTTVGGRLDTGYLGEFRAGAAHGRLAQDDGWRYQAGYSIELTDGLQLSVRNEWDAPGFADLGHYRGGVVPGVRRNWQTTIPTRRWGDISGTYESFRPDAGTATERFGFSQQFWYSPNLRIGLEAQREMGSGDYDIGIRFSVPIN